MTKLKRAVDRIDGVLIVMAGEIFGKAEESRTGNVKAVGRNSHLLPFLNSFLLLCGLTRTEWHPHISVWSKLLTIVLAGIYRRRLRVQRPLPSDASTHDLIKSCYFKPDTAIEHCHLLIRVGSAPAMAAN